MVNRQAVRAISSSLQSGASVAGAAVVVVVGAAVVVVVLVVEVGAAVVVRAGVVVVGATVVVGAVVVVLRVAAVVVVVDGASAVSASAVSVIARVLGWLSPPSNAPAKVRTKKAATGRSIRFFIQSRRGRSAATGSAGIEVGAGGGVVGCVGGGGLFIFRLALVGPARGRDLKTGA